MGRFSRKASEWRSAVASGKNNYGTLSFVTVDPAVLGFEFVEGEHGGKRTLTSRDGQHEYVYFEEGARALIGRRPV